MEMETISVQCSTRQEEQEMMGVKMECLKAMKSYPLKTV